MKNHDFTPKNNIFSNFKGAGAPASLDPPLGCTNKRNIKKIKTIHLEHMLYNYIFVYKSISFKNCKIVSPATFVNKLDKLLAL